MSRDRRRSAAVSVPTAEKQAALAIRRLRMWLRAEHGPAEADRIVRRIAATFDALHSVAPDVLLDDLRRDPLPRDVKAALMSMVQAYASAPACLTDPTGPA